jgi:predicted TPR repeat methyltransferase
MKERVFELKTQLLNYSLNKWESYRVRFGNIAENNYKLAQKYFITGDVNDAIFRLRIVLLLQPENYRAHYYMSRLMLAKKNILKAEHHINKTLEIASNFAEAKFLKQTLNNPEQIEYIPAKLIGEYYDNLGWDYYNVFSDSLVYKAPGALIDLLSTYIKDAASLKIIDVGCGFGVCSLQFYKKYKSEQIEGVDISEKMIEIASECKEAGNEVFDKLYNLDYISFFGKTQNKYDVMLAGLAFQYDKNLSEVLSIARKVLNEKAYVAFSVEKNSIDGNSVVLDGEVENFSYSKNYIISSVQKAGFEVLQIEETPLIDDKMAIICVCIKK